MFTDTAKMMHDTRKNLLKEAAIQIGAGGSAGFIEVCIMQPMDLVKTRFQLQVKTTKLDPLYYTGILYNIKTFVLYDTLPTLIL